MPSLRLDLFPDDSAEGDYYQYRQDAENDSLDQWWQEQIAAPMAEQKEAEKPPEQAPIELPETRYTPAQPHPVLSEPIKAIGRTIQGIFSPTLAERVMRHFGLKTMGTIEEAQQALREEGVPEEYMLDPRIASVIEPYMAAVHAMAPGAVPPGQPGKARKAPEVEPSAAQVPEAATVPPAGAGAVSPPAEVPTPPTAAKRPDIVSELTGQAAATEPHLNLRTFDVDDTTRNVMANINRLNTATEAGLEARRGVIPHAETVAASQGAVSVEDILSRPLGQMLNNRPLNEQVAAADRVLAASATYLDELGTAAKAGDEAAKALYPQAFKTAMAIDASMEGFIGEIARGLNARKIMSAPEKNQAILDSLRRVRDYAGDQIDQIPVDRLIDMVQSVPPARRHELVKAGWKDMLYEVWINNLLTNPATHATNATSNAMTTLFAIPERQLAGLLSFGGESGVYKGEAAQMVYGFVEGLGDAFRMASKSIRTGEPQFMSPSKIEIRKAITAENLNMSGIPGRAVDFIGNAVRMPGRLLGAGDDFFKGINYRMELHAQAYRQAMNEALEGQDAARRITQIVRHPEDYPGIKQAAEYFAAYQTFTNELGPTMSKWMNAIDATPGARLVVPFVRTATNIAKFAFERIPILNLLSGEYRAALLSGGAARDLALGKMATGAAVMSVVATMAAQEMITGNGPMDPQLRKTWLQDHQPYSVRWPGSTKWYSYNRLDPIGAIIGLGANIATISNQLPGADADQLAVGAVLMAGETFASKTYLQGLSDFVAAMREPENKGAEYARTWARSLIPAGVAAVAREIDPVKRRTTPSVRYVGDPNDPNKLAGAINGLLTQFASRVPGYSQTLPADRNLWGDPILYGALGPDLVSPIYTKDAPTDPASQAILKERVRISMPGKVIFGAGEGGLLAERDLPRTGVPLAPFEYDEYIRLAGNELKLQNSLAGGTYGLHEALNRIVQSSTYLRQSEGPDGGRAKIIRDQVHAYREAAKMKLLENHPALQKIVREKFQERAQARQPQGAGSFEAEWQQLLQGVGR